MWCHHTLQTLAVPRARAAFETQESVSPQTGSPAFPRSDSSSSVSKGFGDERTRFLTRTGNQEKPSGASGPQSGSVSSRRSRIVNRIRGESSFGVRLARRCGAISLVRCLANHRNFRGILKLHQNGQCVHIVCTRAACRPGPRPAARSAAGVHRNPAARHKKSILTSVVPPHSSNPCCASG